MRWGKQEPEEHAVRFRRQFLWLPVCIKGQCRWLEWADVREQYKAVGTDWAAQWQWWPTAWADDDNET